MFLKSAVKVYYCYYLVIYMNVAKARVLDFFALRYWLFTVSETSKMTCLLSVG